MFNTPEGEAVPQNPAANPPANPPSTKVEVDKAVLEDLTKKAEASSQNFERVQKANEKIKELEGKLGESGGATTFDPKKLQEGIEEKVGLRLAGLEPQHIEYIENYARGANISLTEAYKVPFVKMAVDGLRREAKSQEATPAPSNKAKMFNGKSLKDIYQSGTPAEKQAAWESELKGGVNNSE